MRWAVLLLAWLATHLFNDTPPPGRRRIRQRYNFASLGWVYRLLRALVIVRSVQLTGIRSRLRRTARDAAPAGFRRRIGRRNPSMRTIFGARARKALHAKSLHQRIQRLAVAFSDIDAFTRRYIAPRARSGLSKLYAIIPHAPPADAVRVLATPALSASDTS